MARQETELEESLLDYLARHDAPCDWCGYNLRGVQTPRCPECGGPLDLDFVKNPPSQLRASNPAERPLSKGEWAVIIVFNAVVIAGLLYLAIQDGM